MGGYALRNNLTLSATYKPARVKKSSIPLARYRCGRLPMGMTRSRGVFRED
jgi:hypothetical protein